MFAHSLGWSICLVLAAIAGGIAYARRGVSFALATVVAVSFAMPVWLEISIGSVPISIQTAAAILGLIVFVVPRPWNIRSPLVLLDIVVASLVVLHVASDMFHGQDFAGTALKAYGEWALPYVTGRYALREIRDADDLAVVLSVIVIILGIGGLIEMATGMNLWEVFFGDRPIDGTSRTAQRFGFKRAFGPTMHPIFFGLLIMTLTPWPIMLLKWSRWGWRRQLAVVSLLSSGGIIAPVSRSPVLGMGMFLVGIGAVWSRVVRILAGIALVAVIVWSVVNMSSLMAVFERMGGEQRRLSKMKLDGEQLEISSTALRVIQLQVLWPAYREAGFLGYGSEATSVLPPRVPYLPADERTRNFLKYMDNAYLLFGLRFGWTGTALFATLMGTAIWTGVRLSWDRSIGIIAACLAALMASMAVILLTTWFSYDMGFEVLWSIGLLGGLAAEQKKQP